MLGKIIRITKSPSLPVFVLMVSFIILNIFITRGFLTAPFIGGFFAANTPLISIAIGVALVIISGGIDISLGAIVTMTNVLFITFINNGYSLGITIILCIFLSLVMGAVNGIIIGYLNVRPLIATFATNAIYSGIALWILPFPTGSNVPEFNDFIMWYASRPFNIPVSFMIMLVVLIIAIIALKTPVGKRIYATGNNAEKAFVSGINVNRIRLFVYTFAGGTAGIAGLALTARIGGGNPTIGLAMTLVCIAACVIGGINLACGSGSVFGAVWGTIFLQLVTATVFSLGVRTIYQNFAASVITLIGLIIAVKLVNTKSSKRQVLKRFRGDRS